MCGIVGLLARRGRPVDEAALKSMADAIVHRGPDDEGFFVDGIAGLGFRRLSIIDVEGGHQPLTNEDETVWVVFNGEIYNYKELRRELEGKGHRFRTMTDTEVIVHLYEELGEGFVERLRGMFGIALWDVARQKLILARDPFGIKPLYYAMTDEWIAFGSEIKSVLAAPGVGREVDRQAFWDYLTFQYVPDPRTMFGGVAKLPPAHIMVVEGNRSALHRYTRLEFHPEDRSIEEYIEGTLSVLRDSVRVHMNSDVPRGAFLSSGVDSSAIVALLRELEEVQTFTVGFEGAGGMSEIAYARETARLLGTIHRDTVVSAHEYIEAVPRLIYQQDEPVADPSAIALNFVAELASQYVTVVLSGEGADEIFGGYTIYREPLSLSWFEHVPPGMRRSLGEMAKFLPEGVKGRGYLMRGSKTLQERFYGNAFLYSEQEKALFVRGHGLAVSSHVTRPYYEQARGVDPVSQMQHVDIHTWLPGDILAKADKMTMANSLELRVPFLDKEVFSYASRIPAHYRLKNGTTKYVLREAVQSILPPAVAKRRKLGFPVPTRKWLREEHYAFARDLIGDSTCGDLFDREHVLHLLEDHRSGVRDNARKVWAIVVFLLWHQTYVDQSRPFVSRPTERVMTRRAGSMAEAML